MEEQTNHDGKGDVVMRDGHTLLIMVAHGDRASPDGALDYGA